MANAPERQPFANDPASKPSQPGKPTAADITHNTIHLIWERPQFEFENVTSYMVHYCQVNDTAKQWTHLKTLTRLNHIPITQLAPSTKYLFKVSAVCEAGHGPDSEMSDPIATSPPPAPGKAGKPTATNVTHNSVELSWSCPELGTQTIKYYSVLFRRTDNPSDCWQTRRTESAQPCLVVSGLAAGAVYCFKVRAQCEGVACSDSEMSDPIATRPIPPVAKRPSKPTASKVTHNSIQISWSNPEATSQDVAFFSVMYLKINDPLSQWMTQRTLDTEKVATVSGLDAKTLYCFKVRVEGENGECRESEVSDFIATSPLSISMPEKPGQPVAIQVTHNSVHLTWSNPELGTHNIKFYSVLYRRMDDPSSQWQTHITPGAQEVATVSGLAAKAMYCFKVCAECEGDVCSESEVSDLIATNAQPVPGKPGKPTPTKVTHNTIQLIWSRCESEIQDIKCYSVLYRQMDDPSSQWQTQNIPDVQVTTTIRGLTANAVYCLKVRAMGEDGVYSESEMSDPVATSPHPLPAKPGQPIVTKVTHNSVQLAWSGPEAGTQDVTFYSVVYRKMDDPSSQWQMQITPDDQQVTVNSLAPNAVYCFKVRAVGEDGVYSESEMSDPVATSPHLLTEKPGQPVATQVTHNSAHLTWSSPELGTHSVKFYSVLYRRMDDPSSQWQTHITPDAQKVATVSGLAAKAMYCFKVRAECEGDVCSESEVSDLIATNAQPVPGKPGQPIVSEVSHNSMQLKWARPESGSEGIKCYTVLYRRMDNPSSQWQLQNTQDTQEVAIVNGLAANVLYCFKVRAECEAGVSVESEMSDPVATRPSPSSLHPGKHKVANTSLTHNTDTDIIPPTEVNSEIETYPFESLILDQPSCININSEVSTFRNKLKGRLAEEMLSSAQLIEKGPPAIYKLKVQNVAVDKGNQLKKCAIGHADPLLSADEKVILVLGATGAGKTTLINGMANYFLGVQWEDEFRFQVVTDETDDDTSQAHSQTKWITAYTFHHQKGSPLPYTLTLIDTPGFGDTGGLQRDHHITEQIKHFFSAPPPVGIDHLNAIGFVTQAVLARLSPTQKYIFDSILAIFGKDIASNIFMMATFADGGDPPVLAAIKEANIPFCDLFKFNNSSLYASHHGTDMFSKMFWEMGLTSFETFFAHLTTVEARSLRLTRLVLDEREHLEAIIQGLLPQIKYIMSTMDRLQQEEKVLERLQLESLDLESKEFTYTVTAIHQRRIDLPTGEYITNCTKCNRTCHYPCKISDDASKWRCAAMNWKEAGEKSVCQVCLRGCEWHNHCNNTFRIETFEEQEKRILDDMLKRLKIVEGDKNAVKTGVYRIQQKVRNLKRKVFEMICEAHQILARLDEIALKPNPLTELDYIDLLIESEKQECKPGYMKRLEYLQEFRQYAKLIHQTDDSVDSPQWLKESVQKARERMLRRIELFQQQVSNVHPHHTQGQFPSITSHEFPTREQTFKHQQSSQSQHASFKPIHAQPPKMTKQEALMYQMSGHQHSPQWLNSNPSSDPAHAQPPRVDGREASTGQEHTAIVCPDNQINVSIATNAQPVPGKPGQPIVSEVSHNSMQLKWARPESASEGIKCYTVLYRRMDNPSSQWQLQNTQDAQEVAIVNGLAANVLYCFKVRAECEAGVSVESEMSDPVATRPSPSSLHPGKHKHNTDADITPQSKVKCNRQTYPRETLPLSQPSKPDILTLSHDTVLLKWNQPTCRIQDIKYYTVSYYVVEDYDFPDKWKTQRTEGPTESVTVTGLNPNAVYCFKVRADSDTGCSSYSESSDPIQLHAPSAPSPPGKPTAADNDVIHNRILLKWGKPDQGGDYVKRYCISYRRRQDPLDQWQTRLSDGARTTLSVSGLDPKTEYCFKVHALSDYGTSNPSNVSTFETKTKGRLAEEMLSSAQFIEKGPPAIYKLKVQNVAVDKGNQLKKCAIGHADPLLSADEKVILVLGAAGAGKTTLINGMANYFLGVQWEDEFRFQVVTDETDDDTSQAHSQTKWITAYTFHHQKGSPLPYTLTLIDTPGFGDTGGLQRDHHITEQIKHFFSAPPPVGIDHLNAIGFVTQAVLARLSPTQKYIFDSILAIFGKDIASNIFMMATFADGGDPPVLAAIKEANIPFCDLFKFNNSSLYASRHGTDMFSKMFWEMGLTSFETFFAHLTTVEARSLRLTRLVLDEREHLEAIIQGLLPQIKYIMSTMDRLQQEGKVLEQLQLESSDLESKEFTYTVTAIHQRRIDLPTGEYITNCTKCNFTCHYPCKISDDANKWRCAAMNWKEAGEKSVCQVCLRGCEWHNHCSNTFRIEYFEKQEERILDDLLKKLKIVKGDKNAVKTAVHKIQQRVNNFKMRVFEMICEAHQILARLDEIALKPNPLTELDYIDLLIESEKQECKPGYMKRLEYLQEFRQYAKLIHQTDDSVDSPQWLKESVQKARERMLRRIELFQQQVSNVHPHHTQGQFPSITSHEFPTREQTFKHQQSSQSQHASFKPIHAQPPKMVRQEALMHHMSGHQHSPQWQHPSQYSTPMYVQPSPKTKQEGSTADQMARQKRLQPSKPHANPTHMQPPKTTRREVSTREQIDKYHPHLQRKHSNPIPGQLPSKTSTNRASTTKEQASRHQHPSQPQHAKIYPTLEDPLSTNQSTSRWWPF